MNTNLCVKDAYNSWISDCEKRVSSGTLDFYKCHFKKHVLPFIGEEDVNVSDEEIDVIFNNLDKDHPWLPRLTKGVLGTFFNYMFKKGWIKRKPNIKSRSDLIIKKREVDSIQSFLSPLDNDDINKAIPFIKESKYKRIYNFVLYTGLRKNECLALKWEDVSSDYNYIMVSRKVKIDQDNNQVEIVNVSLKRHRKLFLTNRAKEVLLELSKLQHNKEDYIFVGDESFEDLNQNIIKENKRIQKKAKIKLFTIDNIAKYFSTYYLSEFMNDFEIAYYEGDFISEFIDGIEIESLAIESKIRLINKKIDNVIRG